MIKYSTPFLTILGLLLLAIIGKSYGTQEIKISSLGRRANFAQVILKGRVSEDIRFHSAEGDARAGSRSLEFNVDDGTGVIRVRCYEDAYQEMLDAKNIPGFGDRVRLIGNYQYKAKRQFVILSSTLDLAVEREKPDRATPILSAIGAFENNPLENHRLKVTGCVQGTITGRYDRVWWLADPAGASLAVTCSYDMMAAYGATYPAVAFSEHLKKGDFVTCYGTLTWSKSRKGGDWQLIPASPDDFVRATEQEWRAANGGY